MMTYNEQRSANKDLEAPRYYNAPMAQQLYMLIANQIHPQSICMNTHFNPGYLQHNNVHFVQNYPLSQSPSQPLNQTQTSQPQTSQYQAPLGYQQMYEGNNYMPVQSMQRSSQQLGPYGTSLMHTLTLAQVTGMGLNSMPSQMNGQMAGQIAAQMGTQMGSQMSTQMNGQLPNQMTSQMNAPIGMTSQMATQMASPVSTQMSSQMTGQMAPQVSGQSTQIGNSMGMAMSGISQQTYRNPPSQKQLIERLQELLPVPPLIKACTRPDVTLSNTHKRTKRKSKFSKRQDEMIVRLKKEGRPWVEIAEMVGVGSYLAARNRYQVIVGQQGNNNSLSWTAEDRDELQKLLDSAELDKWRYIAMELSKATGKNYTAEECRDHARQMFWQNPAAMGVLEATVQELHKEKRVTERLLQAAAREDYDYLKKYDGSPELSM